MSMRFAIKRLEDVAYMLGEETLVDLSAVPGVAG